MSDLNEVRKDNTELNVALSSVRSMRERDNTTQVKWKAEIYKYDKEIEPIQKEFDKALEEYLRLHNKYFSTYGKLADEQNLKRKKDYDYQMSIYNDYPRVVREYRQKYQEDISGMDRERSALEKQYQLDVSAYALKKELFDKKFAKQQESVGKKIQQAKMAREERVKKASLWALTEDYKSKIPTCGAWNSEFEHDKRGRRFDIKKVHRLSELNDDTKSYFPQSMRDNKEMHKRIWGWGLKYNGELGKTTRNTGKPWGSLNHVVDADWIGYPMGPWGEGGKITARENENWGKQIPNDIWVIYYRVFFSTQNYGFLTSAFDDQATVQINDFIVNTGKYWAGTRGGSRSAKTVMTLGGGEHLSRRDQDRLRNQEKQGSIRATFYNTYSQTGSMGDPIRTVTKNLPWYASRMKFNLNGSNLFTGGWGKQVSHGENQGYTPGGYRRLMPDGSKDGQLPIPLKRGFNIISVLKRNTGGPSGFALEINKYGSNGEWRWINSSINTKTKNLGTPEKLRLWRQRMNEGSIVKSDKYWWIVRQGLVTHPDLDTNHIRTRFGGGRGGTYEPSEDYNLPHFFQSWIQSMIKPSTKYADALNATKEINFTPVDKQVRYIRIQFSPRTSYKKLTEPYIQIAGLEIYATDNYEKNISPGLRAKSSGVYSEARKYAWAKNRDGPDTPLNPIDNVFKPRDYPDFYHSDGLVPGLNRQTSDSWKHQYWETDIGREINLYKLVYHNRPSRWGDRAKDLHFIFLDADRREVYNGPPFMSKEYTQEFYFNEPAFLNQKFLENPPEKPDIPDKPKYEEPEQGVAPRMKPFITPQLELLQKVRMQAMKCIELNQQIQGIYQEYSRSNEGLEYEISTLARRKLLITGFKQLVQDREELDKQVNDYMVEHTQKLDLESLNVVLRTMNIVWMVIAMLVFVSLITFAMFPDFSQYLLPFTIWTVILTVFGILTMYIGHAGIYFLLWLIIAVFILWYLIAKGISAFSTPPPSILPEEGVIGDMVESIPGLGPAVDPTPPVSVPAQ